MSRNWYNTRMNLKAESYTEALRHAWHMTWHHPRLWILGFMAALIGSGGIFEFVSNFFVSISGGEARSLFEGWEQNVTLSGFGVVLSVVMLLAILALLVGLVALLVSAQGGLIYAVKRVEDKASVHIGKLFRRGKRHLRDLLILNIAKILILGLLLYVMNTLSSYYIGNADVGLTILFLIVSLVVLLAGLLVSFLVIYAACYVMLHERKWKEAALDAWALFSRHWLVSIEMALVLFFVGVLFVVVAVAGISVLAGFALAALALSAIFGSTVLAGVSVVALSIVGIIWIILAASTYTTFVMSGWTVLFMQMDRSGFLSPMITWFKKKFS